MQVSTCAGLDHVCALCGPATARSLLGPHAPCGPAKTAKKLAMPAP
jgi:hypothetical protein